MTSKNSLADFCAGLKKYDHYLLSCHIMPEGDAIGSILAMDSLLRRMGKKTTVICEDPFPNRLTILSSKRWQSLQEAHASAGQFQALLTTDCPVLSRIGRVRELITPDTVIFNLDHHISNEKFGDYNYIRTSAAACGEVVYDIFKKMKMKITKDDAKNIYVALATDTGSFKYSNTTVECHELAAELIKTGIDIEKINDSIHSTYSLNKINLYSKLLSRFKTASRGQIAWASVTRKDIELTGAEYEDIEGFVDFLKYLKEVKIVFFLSELPGNGHIRVSFRSKEGYDANKIATFFNGGGHKEASGCVIRSNLAKAEKMILDVIQRKTDLKGK